MGGDTQDANLTVVGALCELVDLAFARQPQLRERFPQSTAGCAGPSRMQHVRDRPGHDRRYAMDSGKIRARLKFRATTTFSAGLAQTVRWYLENESWWRAVVSGEYRDWYERQYARGGAQGR